MTDEFSLAYLERLCREYDELAGEYPEDTYQGITIFIYVRARLQGASKDEAYRQVSEQYIDDSIIELDWP